MKVDYARQFLSVAGVLGVLLVALYLLKRHAGGVAGLRLRAAKTRTLEVVERTILTPQHSLHVVRVGTELILFSAGPGGVALIKSLEKTESSGAGSP